MGVWLSGENGQDTKFERFCSDVLWEGQIFQKLFVYVNKTLYFPICGQKCQTINLHPFRVVGAKFAHFSVAGMLGLVVFFFLTSLAPKPSLFWLVCFAFLCVSFFRGGCFCLENNFQCLQFFLLSLPFFFFFSLSLSMSLLLFFLFFCFLVLGLVFLPCVFAFFSW